MICDLKIIFANKKKKKLAKSPKCTVGIFILTNFLLEMNYLFARKCAEKSREIAKVYSWPILFLILFDGFFKGNYRISLFKFNVHNSCDILPAMSKSRWDKEEGGREHF